MARVHWDDVIPVCTKGLPNRYHTMYFVRYVLDLTVTLKTHVHRSKILEKTLARLVKAFAVVAKLMKAFMLVATICNSKL